MRILLVGHGRLGRAIEALCPSSGVEIAATLDELNNAGGCALVEGRWTDVDVAIDASTPAAFAENFPKLVALGVNLVVGTTGWQAREAEVREAVARAGIGAVVAPNFSIGAALLDDLAARAVGLLAAQPEYSAWVREAHHAAKQDAPSGTALRLVRAIETAGYPRPVDVSSTRAGFIPGTHTAGFEGRYESLTLTHTVRDRAVFAEGALAAARWVCGRTGWFTMRDVLGMEKR
jgi:4-hydroxy-tetrahydrodipicolinate reductase